MNNGSGPTGPDHVIAVPTVDTEKERRRELRSLAITMIAITVSICAGMVKLDFFHSSGHRATFGWGVILVSALMAVVYLLVRRGSRLVRVISSKEDGIIIQSTAGTHRVRWDFIHGCSVYSRPDGMPVAVDLFLGSLKRKCRLPYLENTADLLKIIETQLPRTIVRKSETSMTSSNRLRHLLIPFVASAASFSAGLLVNYLYV